MEQLEEIELQEPQQQPDPPTKKRALYDAVSKKYNLGTYEEYETKLKDPTKRKALYDFIGKEYELGTYQDFEAKVTDQTVKKKSSLDFSGSSLEAGNALSQSGGVDGEQIPTIEMYTAPNGEMVEANPIALSKKYNELSTKTKEIEGLGDRGTMKVVDDEDARKSAAKLKEDFKDIDLGGIYEETKDIPDDVLANVGKELMADREQNYPLYQRKLANIKWRHGLEQQILADVDNGNITPENYNRIKDGIEMLPTFTGSGDYSNQRGAIQSLAKDIQLYGGANKQQILQDFAVEVSKVYGSAYKNNFDKYAADTPESKYLNNDEQLALQYLKDIAPEQAAQYDRLMVDPKLVKDDPDALKGYNRLKQTLEETGIGLQLNSVKEELNNLNNIADRDGVLTDEQISKAVELEKKYGELTQKLNELDKKYPERIEDKVDDALQEIRGQKIAGLNYFGGTAYRSIKNTGQGIWEAVSTPFMSDASNTFRELYIMGEGIEQNNLYHKTDKNTAILTSEMVIEPELQKQIDAITNNKVMSESEKDMKVYRLLKDNTDKFGRVPVKGGKFNINPSSIMYGLSDLGTMLLPFVALETVTGGGATAGLARKFISTFTAAAATTFHAEYESALLSGVSQSDAYKEAMGMTAISSLAMAGAGTPAKIKAMVNPKTSAGQLILSMSDDAIQKVLDKGTPVGLKIFKQRMIPVREIKQFGRQIVDGVSDRLKATPAMLGQGAKTGAEFEVAMTAANEAKHQIYDTEIDREANFKNSLLMIGNFSGLGLMGQARFKTPTQMQKGAGLMFGAKPKEYIAVAEQMRKDGQLNESEFNQRVELINQFGDAYKSVPKDLPENRKAEYLYQTVIKNEANKGKSDLPPKQAAQAEHTALVADYTREMILEPPTDKQLESRKNTLEKQMEAKDAEGKLLLDEKEQAKVKAQLEAVNNESETRKSFEKVEMKKREFVDTKLSEPVEGLNEQGIPTGKDVPPPTEQSGKEVPVTGVKHELNAFHGTGESNIENFDVNRNESKDKRLIKGVGWFSDHEAGAKAFGGNAISKKISFDNPLVIDAKDVVGKEGRFKLPNGEYVYEIDRVKELYVQRAKDKGHDGVIFINAKDGNMSGTVYGVFKNENIKEPTPKQQSGKDVVVDEGVGKDNPVLKDVESTAEWISENRDKLGEVDRFGNVKDFLTEKQNKDFFESNSDWDTYVAELYHNGKLRKEDVAKIEQSLSTKPEIKNEGSVGVGGDGKSEFTDVGYVVARKKADDILDDKKEATPVVGLRNAGSGSGVFVPFRMVKDEWIDSETTKREEGETYIYDEVNNKYYNTKDFSKSELDFLTDRDNFSEQPKSETKPIKIEEAKKIANEEAQVAQDTNPPTVKGKEQPLVTDIAPETKSGEKGKEPPPAEPTDTVGEGKDDIGGITHAANEVRRMDRKLPEYEKEPQKFEQWNNEAEQKIKDGYDVEKLMDEIQNGKDPNPVENAIRKIYIATLDAEIAKNPTNALLAKQKRFIEIGDLANSRAGRNLVSLKGEGSPLSTISDFYVAKMDALGAEVLTESQKAEVKKQYENVQKTNEEAALKIQKLQEENAKLRAEAEIRKAKSTTKRDKKDFVKEREDIKKSILDKWNKAKNVGIVADPSKDLLMDIAPDVAKLMKSYIQEGVVKLEEIVTKIHEELKGYIPNITEKNINDIIAGQYDKPRETKGDLLAKLRGIKDKKSEEAVKIQARIKAGDFDPPKKIVSWVDNPEIKKNFPKEYNAALDAIKAKEDARHEFDIALLRDQMARRTLGEKGTDFLSKAAGTVKAITTGIDDSAVAIQTYVSMLVRPRTGVKAFYQHIRQGASQKKFDRWLSALHNSPDFKEMRDMGLDITEPSSLKEREKEEIFNNRFSGTIKIKGKEYKILDAPLKPFERAFTTLGNVTRVVGYRTMADKYKQEGYTIEKDPELFKSLAKRLNTETGRGDVNEYVEMANKVVTMGIWSPKLMAQKFNILGVSDLASLVLSKAGTKGYYRQLHPKERLAAIGDVAQFATTVLALSYGFALAFGGTVDDDPLSSTYLDVKLDNGKSYNFSGGFSGYIRAISQFIMGKKNKDGKSKDVNRLETAGRFFRGKTPPLTSGALDLAAGKNFMGQPTDPLTELKDLAPISLKGIASQIQNDGTSSFFTQGIPTFFGFGVKNEKDYQKLDYTDDELKDPILKYYADKKINFPELSPEKIVTKEVNNKPVEKLSDYDQQTQDEYIKIKKKYIKEGLQELKDGYVTIYKDEDGGVSIPSENDDLTDLTEVAFKDLTQEQLQYLVSQVSRKATIKTKEEIDLKTKKKKQQ